MTRSKKNDDESDQGGTTEGATVARARTTDDVEYVRFLTGYALVGLLSKWGLASLDGNLPDAMTGNIARAALRIALATKAEVDAWIGSTDK